MQEVQHSPDILTKVTGALQKTNFFSRLQPEVIQQLVKKATLLRFESNDIVVSAGEASDRFFVVIAGEVIVLKGSPTEGTELCRLGTSETIGEMGVLMNEPRSASVIAHKPSLLMQLDAATFDRMFEKVPGFGKAIAIELSHRLSEASAQMSLPLYKKAPSTISNEVRALMPLELIQRHRAVPLEVKGNLLLVGLVDDPSSQTINAIKTQLPSMELQQVRITSDFFNLFMGQTGGAESSLPKSQMPEVAKPQKSNPNLDKFLQRMVSEGASDLHLSAGHKPRWRIDGDMLIIEDGHFLGEHEVLELFTPIMDQRNIEEFQEINDTDFAYAIEGLARFRCNLFRDRLGVGAVLRQIPSKILTMEQLGLPPAVTNLCNHPKGLVLVTGPTGSGKSTTLAAMMDAINKTKKSHVITLEDPVEFVHQSKQSLFNQREIGAHTQSFSRALKAALREDPDIVLVGEMRDLETVHLALETANTGHLVYGTLHTATAISSIDRIIDMFPAGQQNQVRSVLGESLKGVISQTLLKKRGGGRVAALEILNVNTAVSNMIRDGKNHQIPNVMATQRAQGNQLLNFELARLVEEGKVNYAEALSKTLDKIDLAKRCGQKPPDTN
jgi:pilus retraction protein PilT